MSIIRTADRSSSSALNNFTLRRVSVTRQRPPTPSLVAVGTPVNALATALSVAWPTHLAGDLGILVWECAGNGTTVVPTGWQLLPGSPVVDVASVAGSKLSIAYRFTDSNGGEAAASIPNTGDHAVAQIFTYRGVTRTAVPGRAYVTDVKTSPSFVLNYPAFDVLSPNSLVIGVASRPDDNASTTNFTGYTNTVLAGFTELAENGTTQGHGGGYVVWQGSRATLGTIGTTSATSVVSTTNAYHLFALEPSYVLPA